MSFRLIALTPTVDAAPGETVSGRVEIHNDGTSDAVYTVVVVGLAAGPTDATSAAPLRVPVPAGSSVVGDVRVVVPHNLGIGQHAAAFEATSSRSSDRAVLTPFTISIQSVSRVGLTPQPSTIRARRRAEFHLDVANNEPESVEVELTGEAADVAVSFTPSTVSLQPGQRTVAKGRIKGPRHIAGEPTQHNIVISARGRAATTSVTAAYVQRPLFAHRLRMVVAAVTVVALWLAAIGAAAVWLSNRDRGTDASAQIVGVDTDGDGIPDTFFDADGRPVTATDTDGDGIPDTFVDADGNPILGTDTDGDGIPDTLVDADGNPIKAIDTNGDGIPDTLSNGAPLPGSDQPTAAPEPRATIVRGTVTIDGDPTKVAIALTPIALGAAPNPSATPVGLRDAQPQEPRGKIWSARTSTINDLFGSATRRTVAIAPDQTTPGPNGVWLFTDVLQGQSYEVSFSSPGYDTRSFVVTPRVDGAPTELDVEMHPAKGALSGTVVGPSGPLGAAEIRITDGTLDFATSSASGSGAWSLQGVSTPGVYTVTATLRGYATAVRQVELSPGDTASGITLQMVPGLGTITGRVTAGGSPLGGVTVTASNGETTLTTTTLTEGDIGSYSLPQLAIPATYTVQAEIDGYVTDSRRVPLNGSLAGVDFTMTSTTVTLTGRVLSSAGGGIESAGLIISTGDLQFRASTSPVGTFTIDRLPPGEYTITAEHYQHDSATEFTTLVAGTTPEPLTITLPRRAGPPAVGTGSLVVSVINDDPKIDPPGIKNAEVTISRNRSSDIRTLQDANSSAVTFDNLPIGTYTINVRAAGYNVSAPVTKSVGQQRERAEIQLQKLGQASGTMVDALDAGNVLTGYSVQLYKLRNAADPDGVAYGAPIFEAAGQWTTPETALQTGLYRIEANPPPGYFVPNNQILDTSPQVNGRAMTFLVPTLSAAEVTPIVIPPIRANPYPTITGKIYKPRLNGAVIEYDAVDEPALGVTGVCNGTAIDPTDIQLSDTFGPTGGGLDTFSLTKEVVAELIPVGAFPATCEFTVVAPGRIDATITLAGVKPSDGVTASDRLAAAALAKVPRPLGGTVFWFDTGARVPLGGVNIATAAPVVTGFTSTERTAIVADPRPEPKLGSPSTASAATTGAWTLNGQVFGTSSYTFVTANFKPGSVPVTIDENSRVVGPTGTNTTVFTDPPAAEPQFGIELQPPDRGTISGKVTIQTSETPKYATDMVRAVDPLGAAHTTTPAADGTFTFADAFAGTWTVDFDTPTNHVREPVASPPGPISKQLPPGGSISGFDATFTELATVRVRLFDKTTGNPITAAAGLDLTAPAAPPLTGAVVDRPVAAPTAGNVYELASIPVATGAPATTTVAYRMAVVLADYDLSRAAVGSAGGSIVDARDIALPMVAGRVTSLDLYVDSFKAITGSLVGRLTGGGTENLSLAGATPAPAVPATLIAERVDADGNAITTTDPAPTVIAGPNGTFSVMGAPGFYRVTPAHPQYQDTPAVTPPNGGVSTAANVYQLGSSANTVLPSAFEFTLRTSTLSVNALTQLTGGAQVDGAVFDRYLGAAPCAAFPATPTRESIPSGGATITIAPGTYCLKVNKFDGGGAQIAFPAIVVVTVPRSTATAAGAATVVAPLPALRPTLIGKLVAENQAGGTVELIATPAPVLTSSFQSNIDVSVNGTTVSNLNPNSAGAGSATAVAPAAPTPPAEQTDFAWTYRFDSIPYGAHEITAPAIAGYTLVSATLPVTIDASGPTDGPTFVYRIDNAPVRIALGGGTYPSLDPAFASTDARAAVRLVSKTNAGAGVDRAYTFDASTNTLIIDGVAPEVGNWTLSFDDALHAPFVDDKVKIDQTLQGTAPSTYRVGTLKTDPVGDLVRLTGQATERSGGLPANVGALSGDATMTLVGSSGTYTLRATTPPANSPGAKLSGQTYIFDVLPGTYTLTATKTGYLDKALVDLPLTPAGSMLGGQNVEIQRQSVLTVTVGARGLTLPADLKVDLLNTVNNSTYGPSAPGSTFAVPAGTYRARTVSATYPQQTSTPDAVVAIGATPTLNIVLPRITRFTVTGPANATVTIGSEVKSAAAGSTIEFTDTTTNGTLTATVSATGYRTKVVTVPADLFTNTPVTLLANVTASGSITGATSGTVTATAPGMTAVTGIVAANGTYSVAGLGVGSAGEAKSWTISYDSIGVGSGSSATTVDVTSASAASVTGPAVTVTPHGVDYNFTVTSPSPVAGAAITISPTPATAPPATDANGTSTGVVNENVAFTWAVRKAGFLTRYGSIGIATSRTAVAVSVSMVAGVSGSVSDGGTGVAGATVVVCPAASSSPCAPAEADRTFASAGTGGTFTITSDLLPGTYKVWASTSGAGAKQGSSTLTIAINGDATLSPTNIAITTP